MDVQQWLIENGFERFVEAFEFNEVDWALLLDLSNEDLRDLGVTKLADRKKFLAALATLHAREAEAAGNMASEGEQAGSAHIPYSH